MRKLAVALIVITILMAIPVNVLADDNPESTGIAITVVVPRRESTCPEPTPQPIHHHVYPVHVWESREYNRREIIRVYELREDESPTHIRREPFERDGFRFELAEIVRREIPAHSIRDHVETITVNTQTNDLETVIRLLTPSLEYFAEDGYFGVLTLDITSISIQSDGTRTTSHTATRTREFPHLTSQDTALVPRTISESGVTYNLANVEWRTQATTTVDYRQVATAYTAVATYTRNATRTSTIGYTTTAIYRGQISRISVGRTEFTAHFIGIPIVSPVIILPSDDYEVEAEESNPMPSPEPQPTPTPAHAPIPAPSPEPVTVETVVIEQVQIGGIVIEVERDIPLPTPEPLPDYEATYYGNSNNDESSGFPMTTVITAMIFIVGMVAAYFVGKKGKAALGALRKASCLLLVLCMLLATSHAVYAIPPYGFGGQNSEDVIHFDNRPPGGSNQQEYIHFDPRVTDQWSGTSNNQGTTTRASPGTYSNHGNIHVHNYGDLIGVLRVERLNRTVNVIAGATMEAMDFGAGHFSFTGLNSGNTGLIGHNRGRTNGFFDFVRHLQKGDVITLEAGGVIRTYAVTMLYTIDDDDFGPLMQFGDNRLTLITCVEYRRHLRRVAVAVEI